MQEGLGNSIALVEMLEKRGDIAERIRKYMKAHGYTLSEKSKKYHALDSFVYEYQNAGGMRDNLKIEINYMLHCHILDVSRRMVKLPWLSQELTVLCVDLIEIFTSKIVALMNRAAPRDLYDFHNMIYFGLFDERALELLRKSVVYYSAIGSDETPTSFSFDSIRTITQNRIKTELLPVLRNSPFFDVKAAQGECIDYLTHLLNLTDREHKFLRLFKEKQYHHDNTELPKRTGYCRAFREGTPGIFRAEPPLCESAGSSKGFFRYDTKKS